MNPAQSTIEQLEQALANPKDSEDILRNYATYLENTNMYYKRLVRYFPDMAAFHMNYDCINIEKDSDSFILSYNEYESMCEVTIVEQELDETLDM